MRAAERIRIRRVISGIAAASLFCGMLPADGIFAQERTGVTRPEYSDETEAETETELQVPWERIEISEAADLDELAKRCAVDTNSRNLEVVLTQDISLAGRKFTPIPWFWGVFDGQGHTIRGIIVRSEGSDLGFMRYVGQGAVVRNLNVEGWIEPGGSAASIGGIAGNNAGAILNCSFNGDVLAQEKCGGIAGVNLQQGMISGCSVKGKILSRHSAGGICGENAGSILGCTNQSSVNNEYIETDEQTKSSLVSNLTNLSSFDVSSVSAEDFVDIMDAGGICGYSDGLISECQNLGETGYAHTGYNVGGICGRSAGFIAACTNDGTVSGRKDVGGILGQLEPESIWEYSQDRLKVLKEQLKTLNVLLDTLAYDLADSTGRITEDVHAAKGYAQAAADDLEKVTDAVGSEIERVSSEISSLTLELLNAVNLQDAERVKTVLRNLAKLIGETDFFRLPLNVDVTGNIRNTIQSVLDEREADWWKKLDEYLDSRESGIGKGALTPGNQSLLPETGAGNLLPGNVSSLIPDSANAGDVSSLIPDGTNAGDVSSLIPDGVNAGDVSSLIPDGVNAPDAGAIISDLADGVESIIPDAGQENGGGLAGEVISDQVPDDTIIEDDDSAVMSADAPEDVAGMSAQAPEDVAVMPVQVPEDVAGMSAQVPEVSGAPLMMSGDPAEMSGDKLSEMLPGNVIPEESVRTGSGTDELIEDEAPSSGTTILEYHSDLDRNTSVGDALSSDASHDSDLKVDVDSIFPDTAQLRALLQELLTDSSDLLDTAAIANAQQILAGLTVRVPDTVSFYDNFQKLADSIIPIADDTSALTASAAADIDAVTTQLDLILDTFFDLTENVSLEDRYTQTDVSEQNPYQSDSSALERCLNRGETDGDTNIGGICGCIGFENKIDAEGVLDVSNYLLKDARYTIFAAARQCHNTGPVTAKKEGAGGICGMMEFGIVTDSINTGTITVQEGDFCGGIVGQSRGTVTSSSTSSLLTGSAYVGGIAGKGTNIRDCISCSYIGESTEYFGAIAGQADGTVSGCRYVDYGIGGIDNIGYTGIAWPAPPREESEEEWSGAGSQGAGASSEEKPGAGSQSAGASSEEMPGAGSQSAGASSEEMPGAGGQSAGASSKEMPGESGVGSLGNTCTVTFLVEGEVYETVEVPFGDSLKTLPEVPNKDTSYWVWDDFSRDHIFTSQNVEGSWHRPTTTLSSGGDVPDYLAEGIFYEGQALTVSEYSPEQSPVSTESLAKMLEMEIQGENTAKAIADETESEMSGSKMSRMKTRIRQTIADRLTGPMIDAKTLSVNDYDQDLTVRAKLPAGGRLFTCAQNGTLAETTYEKDGSYLVFSLPNGGSFVYYETLRQNKDIRGRIAIVALVLAAAVLLLIYLIRRKRKRKKEKKEGRGKNRRNEREEKEQERTGKNRREHRDEREEKEE